MRRKDRQNFPPRSHTTQIDEPVGLPQLWDLRCSLDAASNGYAYSTIGGDSHIEEWVNFGIQEGLLTHEYRDTLDRHMNMSRAKANQWLMERLSQHQKWNRPDNSNRK